MVGLERMVPTLLFGVERGHGMGFFHARSTGSSVGADPVFRWLLVAMTMPQGGSEIDGAPIMVSLTSIAPLPLCNNLPEGGKCG